MRSTPRGAGEFSRHRYLDACISFPVPWFLWTARLSPTTRRAIFKRRGNRIRASAVNFFTRSLLVSAPRRGFKESAMVDSFLLFVPPSPSYRRRDDYFRGATVNEAAVTRSKVNPKHVNDFQEGCVHTSLPSIRNSRDHRFRGEQPLRGEDYAISPVTR